MGRLSVTRPVVKVVRSEGAVRARRRGDTLAVEEPLEIRIAGTPLAVTMRTPGHDVELAAGFLVSEGIVSRAEQFRAAIHCGGPSLGAAPAGRTSLLAAPSAEGNTYNVLDVALSSDAVLPDPGMARNFYTTSSCGLCGKASIEAVETVSSYDVAMDASTIAASDLLALPDRLLTEQAVFGKTGGLHAAALFDVESGELLVVREDVGRHNAVDKVVGWAVRNDRLPLQGTVLQVSGRASFELVQKAVMAGIPILSAVSAPSSLAVELAEASGLTLAGFVRGASMNLYARSDRVAVGD